MIVDKASHQKDLEYACQQSVDILGILVDKVKAGIYPIELDEIAQTQLRKRDLISAFAGVPGSDGVYGFATCISIDSVAVHGKPSQTKPIQAGNIVKLDFGLIYQNIYTDLCVTVGVKPISKAKIKLINTAKEAVLAGVEQAITGNRTGDIGAAIERRAKQDEYKVLKAYIGHGIGFKLHENPPVPAYGKPGTGHQLKHNQLLCVEAQVVTGSDKIEVDDQDKWSVRLVDGGNAAMFEYMTLVGDTAKIMTDTRDFPVLV